PGRSLPQRPRAPSRSGPEAAYPSRRRRRRNRTGLDSCAANPEGLKRLTSMDRRVRQRIARQNMASPDKPFRIGVVAASSRFERETAEQAQEMVRALHPDGSVELKFHPASFGKHGHFAGDDASRAKAFLEIANDPTH